MGVEALAAPLAKKALKRALEIEDEQVTRLKRIEGKLDLLLGSAYHDGTEHLRLATNATSPSDQRAEAIKARDAFITAYNQLRDEPYKRSLAALSLVITSLRLAAPADEAQRWAKAAHEEALNAATSLANKIDVEIGRKTLTGGDRVSALGSGVVLVALGLITLGIVFLFIEPAVGGLSSFIGFCVVIYALAGAGGAHEKLMGGIKEHVAGPMKKKQLEALEPIRLHVLGMVELRQLVGTPAAEIPR